MAVWICDVNGVLVDTTAIVTQAFAATAAHYRFPCSERDVHRVKGLWLLAAYRILDPGCDVFDRRTYHLHYVRERITEVQPYPGVRETLAAAQACGIRVGAATSHGEIAEACLVKTSLYPFIDCLVTQEEVPRPKPHPDSILRVLALFAVDPRDPDAESALCVGDTPVDIEAGRAAGLRTVGVTYGFSGELEIRAAGPDHVLHAFDEMRRFMVGARHAFARPSIA